MNSKLYAIVSIVIPTYNHAHFLGKALQSVIDQTYNNWEVIIVDNHSKDNTDEIVKTFKDPRITLLKIHNNGVIAASRNMGICAAKGKWIAFLDSDDNWYPNKLQVVISESEKSLSTDVYCTDEMLVDEATGNRRLLMYGPYESDFYRSLLVKGNCLSPSATIVRRSFLHNNNILFCENSEFATAEDYEFWMQIARAGAKFKFIHSVQGEYLIHNDNNSGQEKKHTQSIMNVIRHHVYQLQEFELNKDRIWRNINARLLMASSKDLILRKQFSRSIQMIFCAFRTSLEGSLGYLFSRIIKNIRKLLRY
jgi:glycosyltransferase involved in cell wall biosynthesis